MRRLSLALVVLLTFTTTTLAQPLADRIPADAVVYVAWTGSGNLGPQYDESRTKAVVEASNLSQLFNQFLPALVRKLRVKEPQAAAKLELITSIGGPLWRHPSAFYFGGIVVGEDNRPVPRLALLCDAGDEAPQLVARFKTLLEHAGRTPFKLNATAEGNLVVVSSFDLPAKPESALSAKKEFAETLARVGEDPLATAYVDGEAMLQVVDLLVHAGGDAEAIKNWPKVREVSGLAGLKHVAWSGGFDGPDWSERAFVNAPSPRKGLLALLDNKPLPDDLLKSIPRSATLVTAGSFDLSRLLAEARSAAKQIDAEAAQNLEKGLSAGSMMVGANLEKDLIDPLGSHWAAYCAPTVGGNGILGITLLNRLDEPARAERALNALELFANNMIVMQTRKQKDPPRIAFRQTRVADTAVHFLAVPFVAPSWAVKGQNLHVGLFPQVVTSAIHQSTAAKDSILDNEAFNKARARLGEEQASGIQFLDLPAVGADGYASVLAMTQLGLGMADVFGIPSPPMVLPPLDKLRPHFVPVIAKMWADERGLSYHKIAPFPGAEQFGPQNQVLYSYNAMLASVLLPSLNRARETANRVKCAGNLRQIGLANLLYSNENRGKYAPSLGELLRTQDITIDVFACPSSGNTVPRDVMAGGMDAKVAWVNEHASYVYLGDGKTNSMPAEDVLCYERMDNHDRDGINILFGDGRVEFLQRSSVEKLFAEKGIPLDGAPPPKDDAAAPAPPRGERPAQPLRPRPRPTP